MHEIEQAPYRLMIREMQPDERPRERLRSGGPAALSNSELLAILLNTGIKGESVTSMAQRLLHDCGGLTGLMRMEFVELAGVRAAEVFRDAVRHNSVGIVLVHNHPSGDPTPAAADVNVTLDLVKVGDLLDIKVVDHLIIGQGRHVSLKRLGLGLPK